MLRPDGLRAQPVSSTVPVKIYPSNLQAAALADTLRTRPTRWLAGLALVATAGVFIALTAVLHDPGQVSAHADKRAEGAELFAARGCSHCHGVNGEGSDTGPALRGVRSRLSATQIQRQIVAGGKQMPAFGSTLDAAQVEGLVVFLRAKTWIAAPPLPVSQDVPGSDAH